MTFDSHSLERLKELGRKLPKVISNSQPIESKKSKATKKQKLHRVEIENNPDQLFRELMEISPDGNVPTHLLERLKELESKSIQITTNKTSTTNESPQELSVNESLKLYTQFKQLLLEDEVN
tara:strand:+ start:427 stop:792 length:366 start_codon:yes stop_codon:yes gene_type:complete